MSKEYFMLINWQKPTKAAVTQRGQLSELKRVQALFLKSFIAGFINISLVDCVCYCFVVLKYLKRHKLQ